MNHWKNKEKVLFDIQRKTSNYQEAKEISKDIDGLLGFNCPTIEKSLIQQELKQEWIGFDIQIFQTPYSEILEMLEFIKPKECDHWIDFGAAYGRMGIVMGLFYPQMKFTGYEINQARVDEGNRIYRQWQLTNSNLQCLDISHPDFQIESANIFFIYDFGTREDIYILLNKLKEKALKQSIKVITRGRGCRQWIMLDFPWLANINEPIHFEHWSIFTS